MSGTLVRSISALVFLIFFAASVASLVIDIFVYDVSFDRLSHDIQTTLLQVISGFLIAIPLIYDTFRSVKVKYYVCVVAVCAVLLYLIAIPDNPYFFIFCTLLAALMTLFSTRWFRFARIFYGICSTLFFLLFLLFVYAFTYGHYGVNPLDPSFWNWDEIVITLAILWLLFRSWCRSTYTS